MVTTMFATVLFLVAARACASCGDSTLAPDPMFKTLFNALKTGVLEVSARHCADWLKGYNLLLTEESVNRLEDILFNYSVDASQHNPEGVVLDPSSALTANAKDQAEVHDSAAPRSRAATGLHEALVKTMMGGTDQKCSLSKLLARYAFYKVLLHRRLSPVESEMLGAIFSGEAETWRSINRLICAKDCSGLLAAFADGWKSKAVTDVWQFGLVLKNPHVITTLIEAYVEDHKDPVNIPLGLFKDLAIECQYRLAMKLADLRPYNKEIDWYTFYILSRFSKYPSERIRALCLENNTNLLIHEGEKVHGSGRQSTGMKAFSPYVLPKEVWLKILLYLDELTHVYVAWSVCRLWTELDCDILRKSLAVQAAWARDLSDPVRRNRILHNSCYPWNHLFGSRLASFKCLASRLNTVAETSGEIRGETITAWYLICSDIEEGKITVSRESYLDLYVRCCKVGDPPELLQPPGMKDEEYTALIEILISQYHIVPYIPDALLEGNCEVVLKMLEKLGNLATMILQDSQPRCRKLVTNIFSANCYVPPAVAKVLAESSSLYMLLVNRRGHIGECFDIVPRDFAAGSWPQFTVPHSVIDLCLLLGPRSDFRTLELMEEAIVGHCCGPHVSEEQKYKKLKQLSISILKFLQLRREHYSVEELETIEHVLERFQICGKEDDQNTTDYNFGPFINDHRFDIKLVR